MVPYDRLILPAAQDQKSLSGVPSPLGARTLLRWAQRTMACRSRVRSGYPAIAYGMRQSVCQQRL